MIVAENKMAVIAHVNAAGFTPATLEQIAAACMWEARATIVNLTRPGLIQIDTVKASTDEKLVKREMERTNAQFLALLNRRPSWVYQQVLLLSEYDHSGNIDNVETMNIYL